MTLLHVQCHSARAEGRENFVNILDVLANVLGIDDHFIYAVEVRLPNIIRQ